MVCWHRRHDLGDKIQDKSPEDFWRRLVRENVPESEVLEAARSGKLSGIRLAPNGENPDLVDIYELGEYLEYEGIPADAVADYLIDNLDIGHCMTLMEPYAEWLTLWLYDHSGITMSCGTRNWPYNDRWDSGQVGWILTLKKDAMREFADYVLDENGEKIRVEHHHPGGMITWHYMMQPLTDETWRKRAIEVMKADVEVYDQYLTGDVYGFTLYSVDPVDADNEIPDWSEVESCWGFFGSDILSNGMEENVGNGLREAIMADKCKCGVAALHTYSYYSF